MLLFFPDKRDGGKQISNTTNEIKESDESEDSICWVKADDEEAEIASFLEIMKTFSAHRLLIVVDNFEDKSPHYQKLIKDLSQKFYTCWMSKEGSVTIVEYDSPNTEEKETKRLVVMFGGTMALDEYIHQKNLCTVVLVKTSEIKLLRDAGIEEISAKTLLSFRNSKFVYLFFSFSRSFFVTCYVNLMKIISLQSKQNQLCQRNLGRMRI